MIATNIYKFHFIILLATGNLFIQKKAKSQHLQGDWEGKIEYKKKEWRIRMQVPDTGRVAFIDFVDLGGLKRKFDIDLKADSFLLKRAQPNGTTIRFSGKITRNNFFEGRWSGLGIDSAQFILKPSKFITTYQIVDIKGVNDTVTLVGHLVLPFGKGPFPTVILIHGGSAQDRFTYLADAIKLSKKGIASVIYDKRGVGESNKGNWRTDGLYALAKDALSFIEPLKKNKLVDRKSIGVFGHSEGGWVAPIAASLSNEVAFTIASAASWVNASEQTIFHRSNVMREAGFGTTAIDSAVKAWRLVYAASYLCYIGKPDSAAFRKAKTNLENLKSAPWYEAAALPTNYAGECSSGGFLHLLFFDPLEVWKKVKVPALVIGGADDIVVPVHATATNVKRVLMAAGNKAVSTVMVPKTTHTITLSPGDDWDFPRESTDYFNIIGDWINEQKKKH